MNLLKLTAIFTCCVGVTMAYSVETDLSFVKSQADIITVIEAPLDEKPPHGFCFIERKFNEILVVSCLSVLQLHIAVRIKSQYLPHAENIF